MKELVQLNTDKRNTSLCIVAKSPGASSAEGACFKSERSFAGRRRRSSRRAGTREELLDILSFVEYSINFTEDMQKKLPFNNVICCWRR